MPNGGSQHPALSQFPRTADLTSQSPKYWAKEKDRYLRQLLILDIEALTGRPLLVYFAQLNQEISASDPDDIAEIIQAIDSKECDFFLQTPGGVGGRLREDHFCPEEKIRRLPGHCSELGEVGRNRHRAVFKVDRSRHQLRTRSH